MTEISRDLQAQYDELVGKLGVDSATSLSIIYFLNKNTEGPEHALRLLTNIFVGLAYPLKVSIEELFFVVSERYAILEDAHRPPSEDESVH